MFIVLEFRSSASDCIKYATFRYLIFWVHGSSYILRTFSFLKASMPYFSINRFIVKHKCNIEREKSTEEKFRLFEFKRIAPF